MTPLCQPKCASFRGQGQGSRLSAGDRALHAPADSSLRSAGRGSLSRQGAVLWPLRSSADDKQQATASGDGASQPAAPPPPGSGGKLPKAIKLPKSGYFAMADTRSEVYSRAGEKFDPTKRGGRFKSDFIWNTNWKETMDREEQLQRKADAAARERAAAAAGPTGAPTTHSTEGTGAVSFSRLAQLNSMDVDLTEQLLRKRPKPEEQQPQQQARRPPAGMPPPRTEAKKLERISRIVNQLSLTVTSTKEDDEAERARIAAEELRKYEEQKRYFLLATVVLGAAGSAACNNLYGPDVGASFAVGAVGGLVYLRLLSRSVDSVGASDMEGAAGGMAAQPRLLIPVVLGLVFNRWNTVYAENVGVTLQLLPMFVGFLTYKVAVITVETKQLLSDLSYSSSDQRK